jgi:hypothetical protein
MSKSFISVDKVSWKPILLSLQALFHIFLVTYCSIIMSVTKLTVPLDKIDFWKIDSRKVHQTSHIHFRFMQDTFTIISSIEFEHSIFNCILFLFVSFSEEWLFSLYQSMQRFFFLPLVLVPVPVQLGKTTNSNNLGIFYQCISKSFQRDYEKTRNKLRIKQHFRRCQRLSGIYFGKWIGNLSLKFRKN